MSIVTRSHELVPETTRPTIRLGFVDPAGLLAQKVQNQQQPGGVGGVWLQSEDHVFL